MPGWLEVGPLARLHNLLHAAVRAAFEVEQLPHYVDIGRKTKVISILKVAIGLNNEFTRTADGLTVQMPGLIPSLERVDSLFGFQLAHVLRDPVLEIVSEVVLEVICNPDRSAFKE